MLKTKLILNSVTDKAAFIPSCQTCLVETLAPFIAKFELAICLLEFGTPISDKTAMQWLSNALREYRAYEAGAPCVQIKYSPFELKQLGKLTGYLRTFDSEILSHLERMDKEQEDYIATGKDDLEKKQRTVQANQYYSEKLQEYFIAFDKKRGVVQ